MIKMKENWQSPDYRKMRKDDFIQFHNRRGILLTDAKYITTSYSGLYYAKVQWDNGTVSDNFMLCHSGLRWCPSVSLSKSP